MYYSVSSHKQAEGIEKTKNRTRKKFEETDHSKDRPNSNTNPQWRKIIKCKLNTCISRHHTFWNGSDCVCKCCFAISYSVKLFSVSLILVPTVLSHFFHYEVRQQGLCCATPVKYTEFKIGGRRVFHAKQGGKKWQLLVETLSFEMSKQHGLLAGRLLNMFSMRLGHSKELHGGAAKWLPSSFHTVDCFSCCSFWCHYFFLSPYEIVQEHLQG